MGFLCKYREAHNSRMKFLKILIALVAVMALQSFSSMHAVILDEPESGTAVSASSEAFVQQYEMLDLASRGLSYEAFASGLKAMQNISGTLVNCSIVTIADFSQPGSSKRLYVIDLESNQVLFQTYVAHGRNSGESLATAFSDQVSSYQSSLGCYRTAETYSGEHGYSLRLDGLEAGINAHARERAIVMHGADYVSEDFIRENGRLGRSFGCPAVPAELATPIINTIKDGSCLFIYAPDKNYLSRTALMKSEM